jgi:hypothetical protein
VNDLVTMKGTVGAQEMIAIGTETFVDSVSPNDAFATVFEDDGDTGYFYALERSGSERPIVDAVQIYNVANVVDRAKPSEVTIVWSLDGSKSALFLNDYPHAVFDFTAKRAYCRTGFPPPSSKWPDAGHEWSDAAMEFFA